MLALATPGRNTLCSSTRSLVFTLMCPSSRGLPSVCAAVAVSVARVSLVVSSPCRSLISLLACARVSRVPASALRVPLPAPALICLCSSTPPCPRCAFAPLPPVCVCVALLCLRFLRAALGGRGLPPCLRCPRASRASPCARACRGRVRARCLGFVFASGGVCRARACALPFSPPPPFAFLFLPPLRCAALGRRALGRRLRFRFRSRRPPCPPLPCVRFALLACSPAAAAACLRFFALRFFFCAAAPLVFSFRAARCRSASSPAGSLLVPPFLCLVFLLLNFEF